MRLFFWLKIVQATRLASELLYLGRLSGRCEPGKRDASTDHRSPLYSLANGTARVSAVAVIHTVSLRLQKTGIFNREWFSRELVHQGEAATAPGLLSSGAGYRKQESRPSFGYNHHLSPKLLRYSFTDEAPRVGLGPWGILLNDQPSNTDNL